MKIGFFSTILVSLNVRDAVIIVPECIEIANSLKRL